MTYTNYFSQTLYKNLQGNKRKFQKLKELMNSKRKKVVQKKKRLFLKDLEQMRLFPKIENDDDNDFAEMTQR